MTERILDISDRPARLSVRNDLLVIDFVPSPGALSPGERAGPQDQVRGHGGDGTPPPQPAGGDTGATVKHPARDPDSGLRARGTQAHTVPLADIAVLVVSHPQVSFTHAVLAGIAQAGGIFIACNEKHMPAAMMLPLETHSTQAERFAKQASAPLPLRKRAWQQIVQAKIRAQAHLLEERTSKDWGLGAIASQVRSGDAGNLEARAARIYWQALFGTAAASYARRTSIGDDTSPLQQAGGPGFRRDPEGEAPNPHLNYGYAILRAMVARALCAAGLHPSLGVHHHNRYDAFCLADDLMEPFRPLVDRVVAQFADGSVGAASGSALDRDAKRAILEGLLGRFIAEDESRTLFDWVSRTASSLAAVIEGREERLPVPLLTPES